MVKQIKISGRTPGKFGPVSKKARFSFRRGNPLHLCEERYRALHRRWLGHTIPEDISRNIEVNNTSIYGQNWIQF